MGFFSKKKSSESSSSKKSFSPKELKERCVLLQNNAKPVLTEIMELKKWCTTAEKECMAHAGTGNVMMKSMLLDAAGRTPPESVAIKPSQQMLGAYVRYLQDRLLELREQKQFWISQKTRYLNIKSKLGLEASPTSRSFTPPPAKSEPVTPVARQEMSDTDLIDFLSPTAKKSPVNLDDLLDQL